MAVAEGQGQLVPRLRGAIADAVDFEVGAEAGGNTLDHIGDEGAAEAVHGAVGLAVIRTRHGDYIRLEDERDGARDLTGEGSLRPSGRNGSTLNGDLHPCWYGDGLASDS